MDMDDGGSRIGSLNGRVGNLLRSYRNGWVLVHCVTGAGNSTCDDHLVIDSHAESPPVDGSAGTSRED